MNTFTVLIFVPMHDWSKDVNTLFSIKGAIELLTLSVLEIILGIDNIIFISIAVNKLPRAQQSKGRTIGLALALIVRSVLLLFVGWIAGLVDPLVMVGPYGISGKSIILTGGGIFLLIKTWKELMEKVHEEADVDDESIRKKTSFGSIIMQIIIIDFIFSFDSILAAVGVSGNVVVMISAVVLSMLMMMLFSGVVADFINRNQGIKTIALVFLLAIGGILLAEGLIDAYNFSVPETAHVELNKNYAYVALAFALIIELFNMRERNLRKKKDLELEKKED